MKNCIFCKIADKKVSADVVAETDDLIVFKDIKPSAEVHLLIVPKTHIENVEKVGSDDSGLLIHMIDVAKKLVKKNNIKKYRLIFNGGEYLEVSHLHLHLMGGELF